MASWFGLWGAVLAQGIGAMVLWFLYQAPLAGECRAGGIPVRYHGCWKERVILFRFSIPAAACGMAASLGVWSCNAMLVRNAGFGELAIFSAAASLRSMVLFLPALITRVTTPRLNHMMAGGDPAGYRRAFWRTVGANGSIASILAIAFSCAGARILRLFGREFNASTLLIGLLLGSAVAEVIATNLFQALFTAGKLWRNLAIVCTWSMTLVGCSALATRHHGAAGLAFAYLAGWAVSGFFYAAAARRQFPGGNS